MQLTSKEKIWLAAMDTRNYLLIVKGVKFAPFDAKQK